MSIKLVIVFITFYSNLQIVITYWYSPLAVSLRTYNVFRNLAASYLFLYVTRLSQFIEFKKLIFCAICTQKITKRNITKQCLFVLLCVILRNYTCVPLLHGSESTLLLGNCTTTPYFAQALDYKQQVSTIFITPFISIMLHVRTYTYTDTHI